MSFDSLSSFPSSFAVTSVTVYLDYCFIPIAHNKILEIFRTIEQCPNEHSLLYVEFVSSIGSYRLSKYGTEKAEEGDPMSSNSIIRNGNVIKKEEYTEDVRAYYEVIRVRDRALMFLEDHVKRLDHSLKKAGVDKTISINTIQSDLAVLFEADGIKNQNVKFSVSVEDGRLCCVLHYVESFYPDEGTYKKGVSVRTKSFEREQPEIKQLTNAMQVIRKQLQQDTVYEYLLVDDEGLILEGTKTNVFFVAGNRVITADTGRVLGGITRHYVADIAKTHFQFEEVPFVKANLQQADAVFLTGTSIGVLPVRRVDEISYSSAENPVVLSLMQAYETCENQYIETHQL